MATLSLTTIDCTNPKTGARLDSIPQTPAESIPALVRQARLAQALWAKQPLSDRKLVIKKWKNAILQSAEALATCLQEEIGKPAPEAWTSEIVTTGELFDGWLAQIDDLLAEKNLDLNPINYPNKEIVVRPVARGVIALIMPWNYPLQLPLRTMVPALLAGNSILFKPSEHAAKTGALLQELAQKVFPPNLFQTIQGGGATAQALIQAAPDRIVFVGSTTTGKKVAAAAAPYLTECSLELGSKDAAIVLADAPFERAVNGVVWGAFHNAGQDCAAVERVYIERSLYPKFLKALVTATQALRPELDIGPLITEEARDRTQARIKEAVEKGAVLHCGGQPFGEGFGLMPAILSEVPETCSLAVEETFGPVLTVAPYDALDDAVFAVNQSRYGLCASIWTSNEEHGKRLLNRLEVGSAYLNNCCFTGPMAMAAWSGRRQSGTGITGSSYGLSGLVLPKTLIVDSSQGAHELWWYPYSPALTEISNGLIEISRSGGSLFVGVRRLLGGLLGRWKG
jgi:acyl-CoA reductase-like NAD-dependent aldehyde dehydrogenase